MKTINTSTIETTNKTIELNSIALLRFLALVSLVSLTTILLYEFFYLWSIGIIFGTLGIVWIYRLYKELISVDYTLDVIEFTMEDAIEDLERNF